MSLFSRLLKSWVYQWTVLPTIHVSNKGIIISHVSPNKLTIYRMQMTPLMSQLTDSDASDHDKGSTNNPEDNTFDSQDLQIMDTSADTTQSMRHLSLDGIKIVHWNCQGANGKLAVIKDAIQKDGIHILLMQDTRLLRRDDGLPKLRLHRYSTYDVLTSATSHGMTILVHKDILSEIAQEAQFGTRAESLFIRIWVRGVSYLIHNIYNIGESVNLSAVSHDEKSMFLEDFNAHHVTWCRATQNRAGITLSDQLDNLDDYVMMNMESDEYVPTTTYDTTVDLSIIHRDIAAKTNWSIYGGVSSDHFPVMLTWYPGPPLYRTLSPPKLQLHKADWSKFEKVITA